ncbi:MAG: carbamoyltransferase HypF [Desulfobacteraceae bacterium]|nr:carbamoyltransferase HypF [Desulfobacteraceae bacterium]
MEKIIVLKRLEISGVVQGVGFRPFLFGLAHTHGLTGRVSNTAKGVLVMVEGPCDAVADFVRDISEKSPLLSRVTGIESQNLPPQGFSSFDIVKSSASNFRNTLISPDVSICDDCLAEMKNSKDRRFEYPFINCTNCGPRYTIIQDVPYDRPKTSMKTFQMCGDCQKEYDNPMDRRFHAQPNACPVCGPRVYLTDNQGIRLDKDPRDALARAAAFLNQGKILAVKGLGGFHLAVDAANDQAVARLRQKKGRPDKPFALMAAQASVLFNHLHVDDKENKLLESYHRPIVLLEKKKVRKNTKEHPWLSPLLAPLNTCLGVMLPYAPLHYLLLDKGPDILVMTSGNRSGEPLSIDNDDALDAFAHIADYFLLHDRDIYFRADDSIARVQFGKQRFIRRSRGYAPLPIGLDRKLPPVLGCGGGLKSTICLTRNQNAFLSQHIGDLDNHKVYEFYTQTIEHMKKILGIDPVLVAHDLHPGYMSTEYAKLLEDNGANCIPVQHHHAHAVSCMGENHIDEQVIGLTLDGTGYGTDGHIWGGEILTCTHGQFSRRAQLSYVHMPGGDAAVLEPWRMAAAVLFKAYGRSFLDLDITFIQSIDSQKLSFLCQMMEKNLNSPLTSSAGRLFDAVSSLLGICDIISHESQAAMELEAVAANSNAKAGAGLYSFDLIESEKEGCPYYEVDMMPCIREIVRDLKQGTPCEDISANFHLTLVNSFVAAAHRVGLDTGIKKAVLSGGVFNNNLVLRHTILGLEKKGFTVYTHTQVPTGDGGIPLGQVLVAAALNQQQEFNL